jgi:esterase/lipase superfamily enzyme
LEQLLTDVAKTNTDGIFIVAHSIGSALLIETLRQMSIADNAHLNGKIRGIIMISPDIDVDVFTESLKRIQPRPDPLLIFVSKKDLALRFSSFLTGKENRLGLVENLDALKGTGVEIIDVSAFDDGAGFLNHSVAITSPTVLNLLKNRKTMETILDPRAAANKGINIISRVVQTVNDVTQIILNPKAIQ